MSSQLALDGRETPLPLSLTRALNETQRELLVLLRDLGELRSAQAGTIVHLRRERPCLRPPAGKLGCCRHAASDGAAAMKRLEARRLVEHVGRGCWRPLPGTPEDHWPTQRTVVTPDEQSEMLRLYSRGWTLKRIAAATFWSPTEVGRVLKLNGVELRHRSVGHEQLSINEILARTQLYGRGYSLAEIAELRGCSPTSVVQSLKRAGVPRRSVSEGLRLAYQRGRRVPTGAVAR